MKQWKMIAIASFAANVVMVVLLIIAFIYTKSTITEKNEKLEALQENVTVESKKTVKKEIVPVDFHREFEQLKAQAYDLPTEQDLLGMHDYTEAIMHYEDVSMQVASYLNELYEALNRTLPDNESMQLQLAQKDWWQDLQSMQAEHLSKDEDIAKLQAAKEAFMRTMERSEQLLQRYNS